MNKQKIPNLFLALLGALAMILVTVLPASAVAAVIPAPNISIDKQSDEPEGQEAKELDDDEDPSTSYYCTQSDIPHPMGARLAERYGLTYGELQDKFCSGLGWGQIMLALQTSQADSTYTTDQLFDLRSQGKGWGQIWKELGLIGNSRSANSMNDADGDGKPDKPGKSWKNKNKTKP
ncbi:MAG: hypothetical protein EHM41_05065 [Chloroflexi bacterium]|nr:MAG: hypothetical protein EHM41_05065 [Chloroflexota bacterium]